MKNSEHSTPQEQQRGKRPGLRGSRTQNNLERALARDSQSVQLFAYFAQIARIEGYSDAARALTELAESQEQFTHGHIDFLKRTGEPLARMRMGETALNLAASVAIEQLDAVAELDEMARTAHGEGFPDIASWFESVHDAKHARIARLQNELSQIEGS